MDILGRPGRVLLAHFRKFRVPCRSKSESRSAITQSGFNSFVLRAAGKDPKTATVGELDDARSKFRIVAYSLIMLVTLGASHYYIQVGRKARQQRDAELLKNSEGASVHKKSS